MKDRGLSVDAGQPGSGLTAYPHDEAGLRTRLATGRVDAEAFRRPLARCEIASCRGMCCYDGVYLSPESAAVVEQAAVLHAEFFAGLGLQLSDPIIVEGDWAWKKGGLKTAVRPRTFSRTVQGFPPHFKDTACVFLTNDGLCSLQLLSQHLGRHPWYYKPVKCWMHPITLEGDESGVLMLHNDRTDPYRLPGYDGFVTRIFCGNTCPGGKPAFAVLSDELNFLSRIVGRDLRSEAKGWPGPVMGPDESVQR